MARKIILTASALCILSSSAYSQATMANLDSLRNAQSQQMNAMRQQFNDEVSNMMAEYDEYRKKMMAEHEEFRKQISEKWGDDVAIETNQKQWVEYNDDQNSRSVVDFDSGKMKVEVLLSPDDVDANGNIINDRLQQALATALTSKGKTMDYESRYEAQREVSDEAILEHQLDLSSYGIERKSKTAKAPTMNSSAAPMPSMPSSNSTPQPTMPEMSFEPMEMPELTLVDEEDIAPKQEQKPHQAKPSVSPQINKQEQIVEQQKEQAEEKKEAEEIAQKIVEETKIKTHKVKTDDGATKIVATLELNLVSDHISQRAQKYDSVITQHSKTFDIDEPVIYAIMEQESAFNPVAKSWVPAYGLMQLVPTSGGRDAYQYVYKTDKIVSGDYLYDPNNNVELGSAYLKILKTRYFHKVTDPRCQLLCMVAAYNCGAGNVSRAITGNTNITKAIPYINKMSYEELYNHFRKKLPDETKNYIYKITNNIDKYSSVKNMAVK